MDDLIKTTPAKSLLEIFFYQLVTILTTVIIILLDYSYGTFSSIIFVIATPLFCAPKHVRLHDRLCQKTRGVDQL